MAEIDRLKKLAGMPEIIGPHDDDDAQDRLDTERQNRERKIVAAIKLAFQKIGFSIVEKEFGPAIYYDEEDDRRADVSIEETDYDLDTLMLALTKLKASGLSDRFEIIVGNYALDFRFRVSEALDG